MADSFINRAKNDGQVFLKTVNLVTTLSRVKLQIRSKRQEKEQLLKKIGVKIYHIFLETRKVDGEVIYNETLDLLKAMQELDSEILNLEDSMVQARSDYKGSKDAKDAKATKDAKDAKATKDSKSTIDTQESEDF